MSRHALVALTLLLKVGCASTTILAEVDVSHSPISGQAVAGMESVDRVATELLRDWNVPGMTVAVATKGRIVFSRGYGYADLLKQLPVEPGSLFRLASISKPFTALALLRLVDEGKLSLDDRMFDRLPQLALGDEILRRASLGDERIATITIRQLLEHTGGWDNQSSGDPMFQSRAIAQYLGIQGPASSTAIAHYVLGKKLDFAPGKRFVYSNFGYLLLGRIVEHAAGQSYEQAVRGLVLKPAGIDDMQLGQTRKAAPGEVHYHDSTNEPSVFSGDGKVPAPYGGFYLEAMDAHGGWIGSANDCVRLVLAADIDQKPTSKHLLKPATLAAMLARPAYGDPKSDTYYGLGWMVRPTDHGAYWWHNGSLPGVTTLLVRRPDGKVCAMLCNARPPDRSGKSFLEALDQALHAALDGMAP